MSVIRNEIKRRAQEVRQARLAAKKAKSVKLTINKDLWEIAQRALNHSFSSYTGTPYEMAVISIMRASFRATLKHMTAKSYELPFSISLNSVHAATLHAALVGVEAQNQYEMSLIRSTIQIIHNSKIL